MERRVQEIRLPGGERILARIGVLAPEELEVLGEERRFAFEDVGAVDHLADRVGRLNDLVAAMGAAVLDAARAARPDEVSATFGVELVAKAGKTLALLADGEAKASLSVTLTWRSDGPGPEDPGAAGGGGASGGAGE